MGGGRRLITAGAAWLALALASGPVAGRAQAVGPTGLPMPRVTTNGTANGGGGRSASGPGGLGNPFANPYTNPYLNPYMATQPTSPQNAALYFMAAQQMNGGIGSGRLSGSRPATGEPGVNASVNAPQRGEANRPGARAASYFNRGLPTSQGVARSYNRPTNHFPGTGR